MADKVVAIVLQTLKPIKLVKWKVHEGNAVSIGCVVLLYELDADDTHAVCKLKSTQAGTVYKRLAQEGDVVRPGERLLELQPCVHPTVMRDMCAECGADLRKDDVTTTAASVPMVHSVPELKVSLEQAQKLGRADVDRLLRDRKLVLLVDLDQTLIHTTNDNIPANIKDVYHFQLYGAYSPWYHTRLRPGTHRFLTNMSPLFELHICTFGARNYAHTIALFLDRDGQLFSQRILSRDECFNPTSKTANLRALFPCGDDMVCIIDDREDVWSHAANLIHVKPYHFFQHTGDINAPPGLDKHEGDSRAGVDLSAANGAKLNGAVRPAKVNGEQRVDGGKEPSAVPVEATSDSVETAKVTGDTSAASEDSQTTVVATSRDEELALADSEPMDASTGVRENGDEAMEETASKAEQEETASKAEQEETASKADQETASKVEQRDDNKFRQYTNNGRDSEPSDEPIEIDDPDDYLLYLEDILKTIHNAFYDKFDRLEAGRVPDLKRVIPEVRRNVLQGARLVFSGLVPTHIKLEQSRAYQVARSLGATVTQDLEPGTTHLVAVRPGTAKVNAGRRRRALRIVTPDWLWACAERWTRVDEHLYTLSNKGSKNRHPPPHCSSPEHQHGVGETPEVGAGGRKRTPSGRFMDTINPLMSFSSADIADMDREVEDIFNESESDGEGGARRTAPVPLPPVQAPGDEESSNSSSSSAESLTGEHPHGWRPERTAQKRRRDDPDGGGGGGGGDEDESTADDESPSTKFRRGEALASDLDIGQESNSEGSVDAPDDVDDGDWNMMGAALEREFLANN